MSRVRRLAGALQWAFLGYLVLFVGIVSLSAVFGPGRIPRPFSNVGPGLYLLPVVALVGGYLHVRRREQAGRENRTTHARRVESLVGMFLFPIVLSFAVAGVQAVAGGLGLPDPLSGSFYLRALLPNVVGVAVALALAYTLDVRWLYDAEPEDPA